MLPQLHIRVLHVERGSKPTMNGKKVKMWKESDDYFKVVSRNVTIEAKKTVSLTQSRLEVFRTYG
jgi:hypothetical protein